MARMLACAANVFLVALYVVRGASGQFEDRRISETLIRTDSTVQPPLTDEHIRDIVAAIVQQTNALREKSGAARLEINRSLEDAAQDYAELMASENRFGHTVDGRAPAERVTAQDYEACLIAENIAYRWGSSEPVQFARDVVKGWQDSAPHRRNLLNPHLAEIGVGVAQSKATGICFFVQVFGRPASMAIHVTVENMTLQEVAYHLDDDEYSLPPHSTRRHECCAPPSLKLAREKTALQLSNGGRVALVRDAKGELRALKEN